MHFKSIITSKLIELCFWPNKRNIQRIFYYYYYYIMCFELFYVMLGSSLKVIIIEGSLKTGIIYFGVAITAITVIYFLKDTRLFKK